MKDFLKVKFKAMTNGEIQIDLPLILQMTTLAQKNKKKPLAN